MTSQAGDVAQGAAKQVAERVREARVSVGSRLGAEADTRSTAAGEQVGAVGQAMRGMSDQLRSQGRSRAGPCRPARRPSTGAARSRRTWSRRPTDSASRHASQLADAGGESKA
jgi:hypothetical protein